MQKACTILSKLFQMHYFIIQCHFSLLESCQFTVICANLPFLPATLTFSMFVGFPVTTHVSGRSLHILESLETDSFVYAMNNISHMSKACGIYLWLVDASTVFGAPQRSSSEVEMETSLLSWNVRVVRVLKGQTGQHLEIRSHTTESQNVNETDTITHDMTNKTTPNMYMYVYIHAQA